MRAFTELYLKIDQTNRSSEKKKALEDYIEKAADADAAWAIYFLSGRRKKRLLSSRLLGRWAAEWAAIPDWLFEESYHYVGDLAETAALLLPVEKKAETFLNESLQIIVEKHLLSLAGMEEIEQKASIETVWKSLPADQCFVFNKLITGGFRVGVQEKTVQKALGTVFNLDPAVVAHRMMGQWEPTPEWYQSLKNPDSSRENISLPYPFCLAHPIGNDNSPSFLSSTLGNPSDWQIEPKWDGIRAQMIQRRDQSFLWSRGEESVNATFPELLEAALLLPKGTVLDGEILVWHSDRKRPESFSELQKRLGRKKVSSAIQGKLPVRFLAYDIMEYNGADCRKDYSHVRRQKLESIFCCLDAPQAPLYLSPVYMDDDWETTMRRVAKARENGIEGVMLKSKKAHYGSGRSRGIWWKWKIDPFRIDAILIYAQAGHGRRSGLFTDYTFAVRDGENLVPIAKAYSGLSDKEIQRLDRWIKAHTIERFGPVRSVPPEQVFELAFDSVRESTRHKSGLALRFPRIIRWREDKPASEIDPISTLRTFIT